MVNGTALDKESENPREMTRLLGSESITARDSEFLDQREEVSNLGNVRLLATVMLIEEVGEESPGELLSLSWMEEVVVAQRISFCLVRRLSSRLKCSLSSINLLVSNS